MDNTALGNFWWDVGHGKEPLCTECDPDMGSWHGEFEKISAVEFRKRFPNEKLIDKNEFRVKAWSKT